MSIAEIDKIIGRDVPECVQKTDSRYETERKLLLADLSEEGFIDAVAIHEAGHEHYYIKAGCSDLTFVPPIILFQRDNITRPFKREIASIKVGTFNMNQEESDWLLKVAKGYAAGGECSSRLPTLYRYRGDKTDRGLWGKACEAAYRNESSLSKKDIDAIAESKWKEAQDKVRDELVASDSLKAEIINRAKEVRVQLFPWTASR
jgi:hypothetical protein